MQDPTAPDDRGPDGTPDGPPGGRGTRGRRPRPPGGKALTRLVQELERTGRGRQAAAAVDRAVPGLGGSRRQELITEAVGPPEVRPPARDRAPRPPTAEDGREAGAPPPREAAERVRAGAADAESLAVVYRETAERLAAPPRAPGPVWRSLGPWTVPGGQTYGLSRVNVSGRISAIAVDPGNGAHLLAGAAGGGIWESTDRGASWAPRTDDAATLTTGALAFDPAAPGTVLAGTGEGNAWSWLGTGVIRSTDGGTTWAPLCTDPFTGQGFYDLAFDPTRPGTVLAGTTAGLYGSADGGASWTLRRAGATWSVALSANGEALAARSDGLFRSDDGGAGWLPVTLPTPGSLPYARFAAAVAPSDPGVAYAWAADADHVARLWRRSGGTAWARIPVPPGLDTGQAWYDWFLGVAPDRADQVYLGAIDVYRGDRTGTTWSWQDVSTRETGGDSIHPDQHALAFEPGAPGVVYVGNDGGLFRSPDRGVHWEDLNHGLVIGEFEYLAQDHASDTWLLGGTQDNGTNRWTGSPSWTHVQDGDGGDCAVNRDDPRTVFHTFYDMSLERSRTRGDFGTWTEVSPPVPAGEAALFYPPLETSATAGRTVAFGGGALYVSRNDAGSWKRLPFPAPGVGSAMYVPHADEVLVGTTRGRLYRTRWQGGAWSPLTALATPRADAWVSDIHVDPADTDRIWVTHSTIGGGRIWHSADGGATWDDRSAGLPPLPLNAVEVDPLDRDRLWVAADLGVYRSTDAGAGWEPFADRLPNALVGDIVLHPNARLLRAGTRNRGVWEIPVDGPVDG
ncbi:hypothetical protein [Streptomyces sp. NPDC101206]|uniref:hypothetical protein n=1 Tax=Streptomyces sp. NPDC101206 TaxID=3366128 RepID=UPI0037FC81BF